MKMALLKDEDVSRVVADMALCSRLVPLANKVRVAELAVDELVSNTANAESEPSRDDDGDVDEDWLNHFAAYAERASSEHVRGLWARVLAGEIRQPSSFSFSTLRLLSELDQRMAQVFQREVEFRLEDGVIIKPKTKELEGDRLDSLSFLAEVGLLQALDPIGGVALTISPGSSQQGLLREGDLLLVMTMSEEVKIPIIPLTRSGREIARILPPANALAVLERVANVVFEEVTSMEIRHILSKTEGGFITFPVKTLKTEDGV
ncbi:MAG: DUF2806 domain-containing protein [Gammaproteobacteria bacterium]|nr:DUF2806 domain-containing protein [Gammaproteobacteria bacterium]